MLTFGSDPQLMPQYGAAVAEPDGLDARAGAVAVDGAAVVEAVTVAGDVVTVGSADDVTGEAGVCGAEGTPQAVRPRLAAMTTRTSADRYLMRLA